MRKIKKITAVDMAAVILAMSLTACGSSDVEDMSVAPEISDASEISAESTDSDAADEITSEPETLDVLTFMPETCEDYVKLANTYLQADDVIQALAVLDEGIEKLSAGGQGVDGQEVDLLSQRKEYILAGTVTIRTKYVENEYDEDGNVCYNRILEHDENGNIKYRYSDSKGKYSDSTEYQYDGDGNRIEYRSYSFYGGIAYSSHETWAYDENGNEIEYISYDEIGHTEEKREREYDTNGNKIKEIKYDEDGKIVYRIEVEYDTVGNEIKYETYNKYGECTIKIIKDYDEHGNITGHVRYDDDENIIVNEEYEYDENDNEIKYVSYSEDMTVESCEERAYDENGNEIKYVIQRNGVITYWRENEYDAHGNEISVLDYDSEGGIDFMTKYEYDESGRKIYENTEYKDGHAYKRIYEYDDDKNEEKIIYVWRDKTGQETCQAIVEYAYDENKNITKYACIRYDEEKEPTSLRWEREYDEDGRKAAFYFYDNEQTASYQSKTEYDEKGLEIEYTGCDKNGNVLVRRETEYDASGKIIKENYYDTDGNLIRYYENEYDDFGSITRQAMYEDGVLKSEKQTSYMYRYIGDIDTEAADDMNNDMTPEEYNLTQRAMLTRFLNGLEKIHYCSEEGSIEDGIIVEETITDLIDFKECKQNRGSLEYTFLDITGDGIEELIIRCYGNELYVIQCDYGILKVICNTRCDWDSSLIKFNGRTGVGCYSSAGGAGAYRDLYFFDGNEKKEISLYENWSSEDGTSYMYDSDSFEERDISEGEYYDITDMMFTEIDIDWQKLEEPN